MSCCHYSCMHASILRHLSFQLSCFCRFPARYSSTLRCVACVFTCCVAVLHAVHDCPSSFFGCLPVQIWQRFAGCAGLFSSGWICCCTTWVAGRGVLWADVVWLGMLCIVACIAAAATAGCCRSPCLTCVFVCLRGGCCTARVSSHMLCLCMPRCSA